MLPLSAGSPALSLAALIGLVVFRFFSMISSNFSCTGSRTMCGFHGFRCCSMSLTISVMQRLHVDDFVAYLLKNSGEAWHLLSLPVLIDGEVEAPAGNG